jgi:exodeoxyribonuclease VII large subunit
MATPRILTPSQFTTLARSLLEDSFPLVEIEGEISGLSRPASGHLYFNLKDRSAQVRCAMFRPKTQWLRFKPAEGDLVIARGKATLYEARGDFQLIVEHIAPAGEGALRAAFEALKQKLEADGLFDAARKRPLPRWIRRLGVLSSPGGAAIHDVLSVLRRRFPLLEVELLPVLVQGTGAALQISAMLSRADRSGRYDALLLTRGGGSLEDLMAFNDEALARAVFACRTPVVAAIGHETDLSIVELVADQRAPTPSAAAESLSPDRVELQGRLLGLATALAASLQARLQRAAQRADHLQLRLQQQHPQQRLSRHRERLTSFARRLQARQATLLTLLSERLHGKRNRLQVQAPARRLAQLQRLCTDARQRLTGELRHQLNQRQLRVTSVARTLDAVGPNATLARGYAIVQRPDGGILTRAAGVAAGDTLRIRLTDGALAVEVLEVQPNNQRSSTSR